MHITDRVFETNTKTKLRSGQRQDQLENIVYCLLMSAIYFCHQPSGFGRWQNIWPQLRFGQIFCHLPKPSGWWQNIWPPFINNKPYINWQDGQTLSNRWPWDGRLMTVRINTVIHSSSRVGTNFNLFSLCSFLKARHLEIQNRLFFKWKYYIFKILNATCGAHERHCTNTCPPYRCRRSPGR